MLTAEGILDQAITRTEAINESILKRDSVIQKFYRNSVIFITGASGYLGQQLIEKLLRSCEVKKIYVMLRSKKNISPQKRVEELLKEVLYDDVRAEQPNFEDKIRAVAGDIGELGLGIKEEDWRLITEEVNVIVHCAAMVKFDAPLAQAALLNVRGTREVLKLGKACKKLRCYVHLSTAYSNATESRINQDVLESFYQSPIPPDVMIKLAEELHETRLKSIEDKLMEDWPNSYTFTKAITEELVKLTAGNLPTCIVRPSSVICSYSEPYPGWIDKTTIFGATGMARDVTTGIIHAVKSRNSVGIDYVPVDFVNNAIIASAWQTARSYDEGKTVIKIYNVCSSYYTRTWGELSHILYVEALPYASPNSLWYPFCFNVQNEWLYFSITALYQLIPAYLADIYSILTGESSGLVKRFQKVSKAVNMLKYFTSNQWNFDITNTENLYRKMSKSDQKIFNFDMSGIDWREFILLWSIGIRKYILKEKLKTSKEYLRKQQIQKYMTYLITFVYLIMFLLLCFFVYWILDFIFSNI